VVCTDAVSGLLFSDVLFSGDPMRARLFSNELLAARPLSHPALTPDVPWRSPGSGCFPRLLSYNAPYLIIWVIIIIVIIVHGSGGACVPVETL
jgi:hypothetical protein